MLDEDSQCIYHRHYSTGETKVPCYHATVPSLSTSHPAPIWAIRSEWRTPHSRSHHPHATNQWPDNSEPLTVWEELKCPITQQHYYFSNASQSAQWEPPRWVDYIDPDSVCLRRWLSDGSAWYVGRRHAACGCWSGGGGGYFTFPNFIDRTIIGGTLFLQR